MRGHIYAFYSLAVEGSGLRQLSPAAIQTTMVPPLPPSPPPSLTAQLVVVKVGKKKRLMVEVFDAATGALKVEFRSPFQKPAFEHIQVRVRDSNGDGAADQIVVTAKKRSKTVTMVFSG
jgi:hypothetical protein